MNVGGPSRHVVHLVKGLDQSVFATRLLVGLPESAEGSMLRLAEESELRAEIIPCFDRPVSAWRDAIAFSEIVRHIREFKPHIVHTHTTKAGILGRLAAIFCRVPVIFHTYHGHVFSGYFSAPVSRMIAILERFLARFTDRVITLTPGLKKEISQKFRAVPARKVVIVPLGLDLNKNLHTRRKSTNWRRTLGLSQNAFLAGIVARLVPVKNHKMLLEAIPDILRECPDFHLAVVGGGDNEADLRELAHDLRIERNVHFCGVCREIETIYSDLDLLILCSKNEGTPVVILEALASGCPVAATNVGGIAEILESGKYGTLLSAHPKTFADQIVALARNRGNLSVSEQTRRTFVQKYSIRALSEKVCCLYEKFLRLRGLKSK